MRPAEILRYGESTGTSGRRTAGYATRDDWLGNHLDVCTAWSGCVTAADTIAVAVPYELTFAGADIDRVAELLGAAVISVGVGNRICPWTRLVGLIQSYGVTALVCAPTRAVRLAEVAAEAGVAPEATTVRSVFCVGEPCSDAKRARIARMWDATVFPHYGMTETLAVAVPCAAGNLHMCERRFYPEVVDPVSGRVCADGHRGELVLTTLASRALPLVRYRTGDLVRLEAGPASCRCGSTDRLLEHLGRVSDSFPTRTGIGAGADLEEILFAVPGVLPYLAHRWDGHSLRVTCALAAGAEREAAPGIRRAQERIADLVGGSAIVTVVNRSDWLRAVDDESKPGTTLALAAGYGGDGSRKDDGTCNGGKGEI